MTISSNSDLFLAILSMDAYNRGDNAKIQLAGTQLGNASLINEGLPAGSAAAGFSAQAYDWNNQIVISYRGTDSIFGTLANWLLDSDALNGWGVGAGSPAGAQARLAIQYYNAVVGENLDGENVVLTGHSLGGGLAGFVAALYQTNAVLFDNMPFEGAVQTAYDWASGDVPAGFENIAETLTSDIYGNATPWAPDETGISSYYVSGEFLQAIRSQTIYSYELDPGVPSLLDLGPIQRHSQALNAILLYADSEVSGDDWRAAATPFILNLFDASVALASGATSVSGQFAENQDWASILQSALAYSAIDEGERPFGDTGIRALFNDATDLGQAMEAENVSETILDAANDIGKIFVQFAGQLAIGDVLQSNAGSAITDGVLNLSSDGKSFTIDFSDSLWSAGGGPTQTIVGRQELTDTVFQTVGVENPDVPTTSTVRVGMEWLWQDETSAVIDKVTFATTDDPLNSTIQDRLVPAPDKAALFAVSQADDTITGSSDNDFIAGGAGNDTLKGGAGDDLSFLAYSAKCRPWLWHRRLSAAKRRPMTGASFG